MDIPCAALWLAPFTRTAQFPALWYCDPKMAHGQKSLEEKYGAKWTVVSHQMLEMIMYKPFARQMDGACDISLDECDARFHSSHPMPRFSARHNGSLKKPSKKGGVWWALFSELLRLQGQRVFLSLL